jgi:hypothetical protein
MGHPMNSDPPFRPKSSTADTGHAGAKMLSSCWQVRTWTYNGIILVNATRRSLSTRPNCQQHETVDDAKASEEQAITVSVHERLDSWLQPGLPQTKRGPPPVPPQQTSSSRSAISVVAATAPASRPSIVQLAGMSIPQAEERKSAWTRAEAGTRMMDG